MLIKKVVNRIKISIIIKGNALIVYDNIILLAEKNKRQLIKF